MKKLFILMCVVALSSTVSFAWAAEGAKSEKSKAAFKLNANPTIEDTLTQAKTAKERVYVSLRSGKTYEGTVTNMRSGYVVLSELTNMDYFDAVIDVSQIDAVLIQTRGK